MNKKGQSIIQPIIIAVFLLAFAIIGLVMILTWSSIGGALQDTSLNDDPEQADAILQLKNFGSNYVGGIFILVFFGLVIGMMVTSFLIPEHPVFVVAYLLMLIVSIFITAVIGNIWNEIISTDVFLAIVEDQVLMGFIMGNIVKIEVALFLLTILIIFGKPFIANGSGGNRV